MIFVPFVAVDGGESVPARDGVLLTRLMRVAVCAPRLCGCPCGKAAHEKGRTPKKLCFGCESRYSEVTQLDISAAKSRFGPASIAPHTHTHQPREREESFSCCAMGAALTALSNCLDDGYDEVQCTWCDGTGVCPSCKGTGGEIKDVAALRTEMKKVKGPDGEDKMMPETITVNVPQKMPCEACGGLPIQLGVSMTTRSASPFHSGIQSTRKDPRNKDSWKGDGKCKYCKGVGMVKKAFSPTRRLEFDDM